MLVNTVYLQIQNHFAVYGYQKYFTDRNRNAVLRLSSMTGGGGDGITEISNYGMVDFFRDKLATS